MSSLFYRRLAWLTALKGAVTAAVASSIVGFGWRAILILAGIGFVSAFLLSRRKAAQGRLDVSHGALYTGQTSGSLKDARSANRTSVRYGMFPNYREPRSRFAVFLSEMVSGIGTSLGMFQKFAVLAFSAQIAICFLLISAVWIASISGWTISYIHVWRLEGILESAFPIDAADTRAKAMFDALFVPLSLLSIIPILGLGAALFRSAGALLRNLKKYRIVLCGTLGYLAFFVLVLFSGGTSQHTSSLERLIISGNVWGYFMLFCGAPLLGLFLSAELPEKARD